MTEHEMLLVQRLDSINARLALLNDDVKAARNHLRSLVAFVLFLLVNVLLAVGITVLASLH